MPTRVNAAKWMVSTAAWRQQKTCVTDTRTITSPTCFNSLPGRCWSNEMRYHDGSAGAGGFRSKTGPNTGSGRPGTNWDMESGGFLLLDDYFKQDRHHNRHR